MLSLLAQILKFTRSQNKMWMAPLLVLLMALGAFLILVAQSAALAPFIYAIF